MHCTSLLVPFLLVCIPLAGQDLSHVEIKVEEGPNPWNHLNFRNDLNSFQFAIVSDLTGRLRPNIFPEAIRKLNLLQPEFVVTIGDLIEGHTNDKAQLNREWDQFFKAVEPLEMPMFYVPGNHDYWYKSAQNAAGKVEEYDMASVYKQRVGRSYYHFVYRNVLFLILNNTMGDPAEIEEQKRYIAETLTKHSDVRWTFTFFHYDNFPDSGLWRDVKPLLEKRPFTAFSGNSHNYLKHTDENGREMIRLATTGGMSRMRGSTYGEFDHIVLVTVTDKGPKIANLMLDGIYDTNIRTPKSALMTNRLLDGVRGGGSPIASDPILLKGNKFNGATTNLKIVNSGDIPLHIQGTFQPNNRLQPEPGFFELEVPGNSGKKLELSLRVNQPIAIHEIPPLVLSWKAGYTLPGDDPDVEVTGKHRIIIDTKGGQLAVDRPFIVEKFTGRLDPAWIPLGPGGSFNDQGQYMLIDSASPLEGERQDVEGRHTDGPLYEKAVHTQVSDRVYRYTDGRGIFTTTPLFHLPVVGIYRDIPPDSFEANLTISNIRWKGENPGLHWEFWDSPDQEYNYGPVYLSGIILRMSRESGQYSLKLQKFRKTGHGVTGKNYSYADLSKVELGNPPSSLRLRADWRESTQTWRFFYGLNGGKATTLFPGGEFVQDINPSPDGKRNLIYVRKAAEQGGFSVVLDEYQLLH